MVFNGSRDDEIGKVLGRSKKSVSIKRFKLKLKLKPIDLKEIVICKNCSKEFADLISRNRKFCSNSCSITESNLNTTVNITNCPDCDKEIESKSRNRLQKCKNCRYSSRPRLIKKEFHRKVKVDTLCPDLSLLDLNPIIIKRSIPSKVCKTCTNKIPNKNIYCLSCSFEYYSLYRPKCEFKFNPLDFSQKIDCSLIHEFGRYSPSNRGDNINGASLDHMLSVRDGFRLKVDPKIISHPANCKVMIQNKNSAKNDRSSISLDDLLLKIKNWHN